MTEHTILFVDDEKNILKTLQRLFMDEPYRIITANSGPEGLTLLEQGERPTVIVSDQRMPGMNGVEFLVQARQMVPDSICMVLTGYADINAAVDAVNLGGASRYLLKPWNDDDLKLVIHEAVARADLKIQNRELTEKLAAQNRILEELNARLEQQVAERTMELRKKVVELEGRDRIQQHLLTIHPLDETLHIVLEVIGTVVEAENAVIYLDPPFSDETLQPVAVLKESGALADEAAVRQVAAFGEPLCLAVPFPAGFGEAGDLFLSQVLAPVRKGDDLLGVIAVIRRSVKPLGEEDLPAIASLAGLAAIAIYDSRLAGDLAGLGVSLDEVLGSL